MDSPDEDPAEPSDASDDAPTDVSSSRRDERRLYQVTTYVLAAADDIDAVTDAMASSLCPDVAHEGFCEHPWEMRVVPADHVLSSEEVSELLTDLGRPDQHDA